MASIMPGFPTERFHVTVPLSEINLGVAMADAASAQGTDAEILPGENPLVPRVRRALNFFSTIIILLYGFLQWRDLPIVAILNNGDPSLVLQVTLFILFFSWVIGINIDVNMQSAVYIHTRDGRSISKSAMGVLMLHFISALLLLWARKSVQDFAIAITIFSFASIALMHVTHRTIRPIVDKSRGIYLRLGDNFGAEQSNILETYLAGYWTWVRAGLLLVLLVGVNLICFISAAREFLLRWIGEGLNEAVAAALAPWLALLAVVVFLLVAEGWQWANRLQASATVRALGLLRDKYTLEGLAKRNYPG